MGVEGEVNCEYDPEERHQSYVNFGPSVASGTTIRLPFHMACGHFDVTSFKKLNW